MTDGGGESPSAAQIVNLVGIDVHGVPTNAQESLKYHLLGPSLTKAGQDSVDQQKVSIHVRASQRRS